MQRFQANIAIAFSPCCTAGLSLSAAVSLFSHCVVEGAQCQASPFGHVDLACSGPAVSSCLLGRQRHSGPCAVRTANDLVGRPSSYHRWSCKLLSTLHSCRLSCMHMDAVVSADIAARMRTSGHDNSPPVASSAIRSCDSTYKARPPREALKTQGHTTKHLMSAPLPPLRYLYRNALHA